MRRITWFPDSWSPEISSLRNKCQGGRFTVWSSRAKEAENLSKLEWSICIEAGSRLPDCRLLEIMGHQCIFGAHLDTAFSMFGYFRLLQWMSVRSVLTFMRGRIILGSQCELAGICWTGFHIVWSCAFSTSKTGKATHLDIILVLLKSEVPFKATVWRLYLIFRKKIPYGLSGNLVSRWDRSISNVRLKIYCLRLVLCGQAIAGLVPLPEVISGMRRGCSSRSKKVQKNMSRCRGWSDRNLRFTELCR